MDGAEEKYRQSCSRRPDTKRPIRRPRHKWKDNSKVGPKEIGRFGWINRAQGTNTGSCKYYSEPSSSIKCSVS